MFATYFYDSEYHLPQTNLAYLEKISDLCRGELQIFLRLFLLFYVDDTVIIPESPEALQLALNSFESYCTKWKM